MALISSIYKQGDNSKNYSKNKKKKKRQQYKKANKVVKKKVFFKADPTSNDFLNSFSWKKLRMEALKLYGLKCQCCGATKKEGAVMNVDHIKPRKYFPELALEINNLQILCGDCNHGKGNWDMTDWRAINEWLLFINN